MTVGALTCDVCGRQALGVASSGYGPISHAYCGECSRRNAEPLTGFEYIYDFVSTDGAELAEHVQHYVTFKDGRYITWPEYVAERHQGPVCEVHKVHALPTGCSLCAYDKWCAEECVRDGSGEAVETPEEWFDPKGDSPVSEAGTPNTGISSSMGEA